MINFARLKDIREDHDINQNEMANILNVKRSTYSLWELGINIIPLQDLCNFADYFDLSIDYILNLTNNRNNKNLIKGLNIKTLGINITTIRKQKKLSQESLAKILNVTQACVNKYEKGTIYISTSNLVKLCNEFKITLTEICGKGKI